MHPASGPEFTHAGIHKRIACPAALPGFKQPFIFPPGKMLKLASKRFVRCVRKMAKEVMSKFTPTELAHILVVLPHRCFTARALGGRTQHVPNFTAADLAEMQVR